jgi:uncharacterized membrane protein
MPGGGSLPHPFFVHFPIALVVTALILEIWGRVKDREDLRRAATYNLVIGALFALPSVVSGFIGADELLERVRERAPEDVIARAEAAVKLHRSLGIAVLIAVALMAWWRLQATGRSAAQLSALVALTVLVLGTGLAGGGIREAMRPSGSPFMMQREENGFVRDRENGFREQSGGSTSTESDGINRVGGRERSSEENSERR